MRPTFSHQLAQHVLCVTWLSLGLALPGCQSNDGRPIPKTYPVRGKLVDKSGVAVTNAGRIEFQTPDELYHTVLGMAEADGTFSMYTLSNDKKYSGATEGTHQVFVTLLDKRTGEENRVPAADCTVQPGENNLTIVIEKGRR